MENEQSKSLIMSLALGMKVNDALTREMHSQDILIADYAYYCVWGVIHSGFEKDSEEIHEQIRCAFSEDVDLLFFDALDVCLFVAAGNSKKTLINNSLESVCDEISLRSSRLLCAVSDGNVFSQFSEIPAQIKKCVGFVNDYKDSFDELCSTVVYVDASPMRSTMISPADIKEILRLFERGKFGELEETIDNRVEEIRSNNSMQRTNVQPTSIKRFFVEMITFAAHTAYDYGVDVDKVMDYEDPYQVIFSMNETPKIKRWFMESCRKLYKACRETATQDKNSLVVAVEKYIEDNMSRVDFGVAEIAENFDLSPAYLSNCYSTIRGSTVIKYINQRRLESACRYLEQTDDTINEICLKTGYSSINYFYSCFRKKYGITPSEYRSNQKNQQ